MIDLRQNTLALLLTAPVAAHAAIPDLKQRLPNDLNSAIELLESVQDQLAAEDYFGVSGFEIRASWCERAGEPIHKGITIRQAIDLDLELKANGSDLFAPADAKNPLDVRRVCGEPLRGSA